MIADFGTKLVRFVGAKLKGVRAPGQGAAGGKFARSLNMPFRPVIYADGQYAIFDDMAEFKVSKSILKTYQNYKYLFHRLILIKLA